MALRRGVIWRQHFHEAPSLLTAFFLPQVVVPGRLSDVPAPPQLASFEANRRCRGLCRLSVVRRGHMPISPWPRLGIPPSPSTRSFFATSTASIDADHDGLSSLHDDAQNGSNDICAAPMIGMCPTIAFGGDGADMRLLMRYFETSVSSSSRRLTWSGGLPLRREMESTGDH
jgi:hypothetical protein